MHHDHNHGPGGDLLEGRLLLSFALTTLIFLVELGGGFWSRSLALLSDSWHVLTDAAALGLAWFAVRQGRKRPTARYTYGFSRLEVIAAFVNGLALIFISLWIIAEAMQRFFAPVPVKGLVMFVIAVAGLLVNLLIGLVLKGHADENMNVRGAFLHVAGDALSSLGVVAAGLLALRWRWYVADPLISLLISFLIIKSAWGLVRDSFQILMESTPPDLLLPEVIRALENLPEVANVHDLHAWNISGRVPAVSMHVLLKSASADYQNVLERCQHLLARDFGI
ncbi:MAG: cation diffusion facilitator family transporter, partial [Desulfotomaculales bacterium]